MPARGVIWLDRLRGGPEPLEVHDEGFLLAAHDYASVPPFLLRLLRRFGMAKARPPLLIPFTEIGYVRIHREPKANGGRTMLWFQHSNGQFHRYLSPAHSPVAAVEALVAPLVRLEVAPDVR